MTVKPLLLLFLIGVSLLFNSCSITKRKYTGGYYIQWNTHKETVAKRTEWYQITFPSVRKIAEIEELELPRNIGRTSKNYIGQHNLKLAHKNIYYSFKMGRTVPIEKAVAKIFNQAKTSPKSNDTKKRDIVRSILYCVLSLINILLYSIAIFVYELGGVSIIIPVIFELLLAICLILSIIYTYRAIFLWHKLGIIFIALIDLLLFLLFIWFALYINLGINILI